MSPSPPRGGRGPLGSPPFVPGTSLDLPRLCQVRFVAQRPEPERFWVRHAPRGWEGPARPWLDLAAGQLGRPGRGLPETARPAGEAQAREATEVPGARLAEAPSGVPGEAPGAPLAEVPDALLSELPGVPLIEVSDAPLTAAPGAILGGAPGWWGPDAAPFDDLVYLPPVPPHLAAERDALARLVLAGGAPVLVQLLPGDLTTLAGHGAAEPETRGLVLVVDLLAALVAGDLSGSTGEAPPLAVMARSAAAAWPLVPGLTDDAAIWESGCRMLAAAGLRVVQTMVPALLPGDRRRLVEAGPGNDQGEAAFAALFHRQAHPLYSPTPEHPPRPPHADRQAHPPDTLHPEHPPGAADPPLSHLPPHSPRPPHPPGPPHPPDTERDFARLAWRHGLAPFLRRPLPRPPLHGAGNRRAAGLLALLAELWLRVGRTVEQAQSLFRAARWLDDTSYDIDALRREGNLAVLTALDPLARQIVADAADAAGAANSGKADIADIADIAGQADPPLLAALLAEYLAAESGTRTEGPPE